jgi:hypothetical protein
MLRMHWMDEGHEAARREASSRGGGRKHGLCGRLQKVADTGVHRREEETNREGEWQKSAVVNARGDRRLATRISAPFPPDVVPNVGAVARGRPIAGRDLLRHRTRQVHVRERSAAERAGGNQPARPTSRVVGGSAQATTGLH